MRRWAAALFVVVLSPAAPLAAQDQTLVRFEELEEIARFCVMQGRLEQGGKLVPIDASIPDELVHVVPGMPKDLEFPTVSSSAEKERALLDRWIAVYGELLDATIAQSRAKMKEHSLVPEKWLEYVDGKLLQAFVRRWGGSRKPPKEAGTDGPPFVAFREMQAVLPPVLERYADVYTKKKLTDAQKTALVAERAEKAKAYLKRYNLGKDLAWTRLEGASLIFVDLAPTVQKMAEDYLTGLAAEPVRDAAGKPWTWRDRKVSWVPFEKLQADLRKTLDDLTGEFLVARYAVRDGDKITDILRATGGRLLYGTFYVLEYEGELVVTRGS